MVLSNTKMISVALFCLIINPLLVSSQSDSLRQVDAIDQSHNVKVIKDKRREKWRRNRIPRGLQISDTDTIDILKKSKGSSKNSKGKGKGSSKDDDFDLSDCSTYAFDWIFDLQSTCKQPVDENFSDCQCADAERRIKKGQINCGFDLCPENCEVCKVCLYYAIDNCLMGTPPKILPGFLNPPSTNDVSSPTPAPSPPPVEPNDTFDQMTCSTYSSAWSMELVESCTGNVFNNDFTGCTCPDAEKRIANGQINCQMDKPCPDDCTACELCLYYVVDDCLV